MTPQVTDHSLKLARAQFHMDSLGREIISYHDRKPYSIVLVKDEVAQRLWWQLRIAEALPQEWSAIVGDIIHNLRATLDLLMCAVIRKCDPHQSDLKHVHFVVRDSKEKFEIELRKNMKGATPAALELVRSFRPYKSGNDDIWRLHALDLLDKHQAITPVGAAYDAVDIAPLIMADMNRMMAQSGRPPMDVNFALTITPKNKMFPLKDGMAVFGAPWNDHDPQTSMPNFKFDIAFGAGQIIDGEPLMPNLNQMMQSVKNIVDAFEKTILV